MAKTDWEDHPTAYRARIITTAVDPISKKQLRKDKFVGPYGRKGSARGAVTREIHAVKSWGMRDMWAINGEWINVKDWAVTGVVEQLVEYGKWEEVS